MNKFALDCNRFMVIALNYKVISQRPKNVLKTKKYHIPHCPGKEKENMPGKVRFKSEKCQKKMEFLSSE